MFPNFSTMRQPSVSGSATVRTHAHTLTDQTDSRAWGRIHGRMYTQCSMYAIQLVNSTRRKVYPCSHIRLNTNIDKYTLTQCIHVWRTCAAIAFYPTFLDMYACVREMRVLRIHRKVWWTLLVAKILIPRLRPERANGRAISLTQFFAQQLFVASNWQS